MNPQNNPTPEQQPVIPIAEIPQAPDVTIPATTAPGGQLTAAQAADAVAAVAATNDVAEPAAPNTVNPQMAADVDVIEKEWVDKIEATLIKTAGDPHAEEEAIEDLQIDYMKKRYGKDVAKSGDQ